MRQRVKYGHQAHRSERSKLVMMRVVVLLVVLRCLQWLLAFGDDLGLGNGLVLLQLVDSVLFNEGDEALEGAIAIIVNELLLASLLELECGEAGDAEGYGWWKVILGCLHLGA